MGTIASCIILTLCVAYIVDISGVMFKLSKYAFTKIYGKRMPYNGWQIPVITCSTCLSFWVVLIYTIISGMNVICALGIACFCSYIADISSEIMKLVKRIFSKVCNEYI